MALIETIESDYIVAMKAKDADKVGVLRLVKAAFGTVAIEKKKNTLDEAEMIEVLRKQVKQRRESLDSFEKAGRQDLAAKEKKEMEILQTYLPKEMSDDEIRQLAQKAIQTSGAKVKAEMGKVMKELMPLVKGKADGKRVTDILNSMLG